jgi:hypothetical protein
MGTEGDSKGQKHAFSDNGERNVQNPQNMTKIQPRKACGEPFRHKFPALRDPTSVATYDSSTHPNEKGKKRKDKLVAANVRMDQSKANSNTVHVPD